jgi:hypothetical protein
VLPPRCCCAVQTTCTWMRWTGRCMTRCAWSSGCWRAGQWCQVRQGGSKHDLGMLSVTYT